MQLFFVAFALQANSFCVLLKLLTKCPDILKRCQSALRSEFCRHLIEFGTGHLPLNSLVDNTIGSRLDVVINERSEARALLAALRRNETVQEFVVHKMLDEDVLEVCRPRRRCGFGPLRLTAAVLCSFVW